MRIDDRAGHAPAPRPEADDVDLLRARHYDVLAALLGRAPTQDALDTLKGLDGDASVLGRQIAAVGRAASETSADAVQREFFSLFVGVGRGELLPYASYYQTGFLNERPLARVRGDLAAIGVERGGTSCEPEDHIAFLFEVMAGLAGGRFDCAPGEDRRFFEAHLKPWAARFFADLEVARSARFYRPVGALGRAFVEVEEEAFAIDA
jgi:TorA maturation chaperone TorD